MYKEYSSENKNHPMLAINAPGISSIMCFFLFGINVYITEKNKVSKAGTKNSLFEKIAFIIVNFPPDWQDGSEGMQSDVLQKR